jgi:hypothetical protein
VVAICTLKDIQEQTINTETAAKAARLNAQAVINAERPWLVGRSSIKKDNPKLCLFGCRNQGITLAKIISASARHVFVNSVDDLRPPDYSSPAAAATSGGMQSGAAAQKDDGSGYATSTSRRGGTPIFRSFAPYLGYQRDPRDFALVVGLHVAPDSASRSMCSTENSMPEIADLGTGC